MPDFLLDTFTGANLTELHAYDARWVEHAWSTNTLFIDDDSGAPGTYPVKGVQGPGGGSQELYYWDVDPGAADYTVEATIFGYQNPIAMHMGVALRVDPASNTFYEASVQVPSTPTDFIWEIAKVVAGVRTQIGTYNESNSTRPYWGVQFTVSGSTLSLSIQGPGGNTPPTGDFTTVLTVGDSEITAAGRAGIYGNNCGVGLLLASIRGFTGEERTEAAAMSRALLYDSAAAVAQRGTNSSVWVA